MLSLAFAQVAGPSVVEPIQVPYLPTTIWVLATGLSLLIILVALGIYLWYRQRVQAVIEDASAVADLAAKKLSLKQRLSSVKTGLKATRRNYYNAKLSAKSRKFSAKSLQGFLWSWRRTTRGWTS